MSVLALVAVALPALASTVTHSEHVELTEEEAAALPAETSCRVRWIMRANGTFTQVEVLDCPEGYEDRVAQAASRWTFGAPGPKANFAQVHLRPPKAPAAETSPVGPAREPSALAQLLADDTPPGVSWTKVTATRRAQPILPPGLDQPLACQLLVDFDAAGLPTAVSLGTCDDALADAAVDAAWRWRFSATDADGQPQGGSFAVRFVVEPG